MSDISLSTMWGVGRFQDMSQFVQAAQSYGFSHIELNYQVTAEMVAQALGVPDVRISSIHNPCPNSEASKNTPAFTLRLTAPEEDERQQALSYAKSTIDLAAQVGAPAIVVHVGSVAPLNDPERQLRRIAQEEGAQSERFQEGLAAFLRQRSLQVGPYLDAGRKSLAELSGYAAVKGVVLGLETRYYIHEIPNLEEMAALLNEFTGAAVGYWHDTGHAENQERLGLTPHREWLEQFGPRMVGVHLHDMQGLVDHKAPGTGDMPWEHIIPHLPPKAARVVEINNANDADSVSKVPGFLSRK